MLIHSTDLSLYSGCVRPVCQLGCVSHSIVIDHEVVVLTHTKQILAFQERDNFQLPVGSQWMGCMVITLDVLRVVSQWMGFM